MWITRIREDLIFLIERGVVIGYVDATLMDGEHRKSICAILQNAARYEILPAKIFVEIKPSLMHSSRKNQELSLHATEPPVPAGLAKLPAPLQSLAHFLGLEGALIRTAAERSRNLSAPSHSRAKLTAWIAALPEAEKNALLLAMAEGNDSCSRNDLLRRFNQYRLPAISRAERVDSQPRTVSQIMALAQVHTDQRIRREAERKAVEQEKQEQARTAARVKHLDKLAGREAQIWEQVDALAQTEQPNNYDRALCHIIDLRDLAFRRNQQAYFDSALDQLRLSHRAKPTFLRRISQANL